MLKRKPIKSFITARSKKMATPLEILFFPYLLNQLNYLDLRPYAGAHISDELPFFLPSPPTNNSGVPIVYNTTLGAFNGHTITHSYSSSNWNNSAIIRIGSLQRLKAFFQYLKSKIC